MKTRIFILTFLSFFIIFLSCNNDELNFADENIVIDNLPAISVYKTKKNYFDYVYVGIDSVDNLTMIPAHTSTDSRIFVDAKGKVTYTLRWRLKSGYIVCKEMHYKDMAFTNITFQELIDVTDSNGGKSPESSWFKSRIIDRDPFTEYYWSGTLTYGSSYKEFTLGQINDMLENGTIETVLKKIK
ncbi:hypothetical protein MASR2M117_04330 [Paludibacter sp.]